MTFQKQSTNFLDRPQITKHSASASEEHQVSVLNQYDNFDQRETLIEAPVSPIIADISGILMTFAVLLFSFMQLNSKQEMKTEIFLKYEFAFICQE